MTAPWLHVVGVALDGLEGLRPAVRALIESAEVLVGAERHQNFVTESKAERITWPKPFDALIDQLKSLQGRRVVVLVTGDPLWYSVGAKIARSFAPGSVAFHPQLAAFQLAACRMGWSLADVDTLTIHGRPPERILPYLSPGARVLAIGEDEETPKTVAALLAKRGFGPSRITALANMGGEGEVRSEATAAEWREKAPAFHTLAIELIAEPDAKILPRIGLPDEAFAHDGQLTKRDLRALTIAKLDPRRGQLLWDVGSGCGSVAIEWMRAAPDAEAIGVEHNAERRAMAAQNALALGAPRLRLVDGMAPEALDGLPSPHAVFIGGGLSDSVVATCLARMKPHGRLVANAVTLESEARLIDLHARYGGELTQIAVSRADRLGAYRGWRPSMPVTQWSLET